MGRADATTKLSLDEWARIMGINPLHFNQVSLESLNNAFCGGLWFQHGWQANTAISRETLGDAIRHAEDQIEKYVGFSLLPTWQVDERRPTYRVNRPELVQYGLGDIRGYYQSVPGTFKNFIAGGQRATAVIEAGATITWSDEDGDGYFETGTVTVAIPSGTDDACEVRVYYPDKGPLPDWEIRPRVVTQVGTDWVITFRRELAVLESLQEALVPAVVNGLTDASFLAEVDVYRVYNDPSSMAAMLWEPTVACDCNTASGCAVCSYATQSACLIERGDPEYSNLGFHPATWDADTESFTATTLAKDRNPDLLRVWYLAGHQDKSLDCPRLTLDPFWARVVARYATAILEKPPCGCQEFDIKRCQEDLAFVGGAEQLSQYQLAGVDLSNPFGTRRGAMDAWRAVNAPDVQVGVGTAVV